MASLTNNATADNTALLTLAELDAHVAEFERMSALYGPGGWLYRAIAPAEATEVVELTSGDLDWWQVEGNLEEDEVILDISIIEERDRDDMYRAGRDGLPWL